MKHLMNNKKWGYEIGLYTEGKCLLYGTAEDLVITKELAETRIFKKHKFDNFLYIDCSKYEKQDNIKIKPGKCTFISKEFAVKNTSIVIYLYSEIHHKKCLNLNTFEDYFIDRIDSIHDSHLSLKEMDIDKWKKVSKFFFKYEDKYNYFKLTPASTKRLLTLLDKFKEPKIIENSIISDRINTLDIILNKLSQRTKEYKEPLPQVISTQNPWQNKPEKLYNSIYINMTLDGLFFTITNKFRHDPSTLNQQIRPLKAYYRIGDIKHYITDHKKDYDNKKKLVQFLTTQGLYTKVINRLTKELLTVV
jgi:hypothetical protein